MTPNYALLDKRVIFQCPPSVGNGFTPSCDFVILVCACIYSSLLLYSSYYYINYLYLCVAIFSVWVLQYFFSKICKPLQWKKNHISKLAWFYLFVLLNLPLYQYIDRSDNIKYNAVVTQYRSVTPSSCSWHSSSKILFVCCFKACNALVTWLYHITSANWGLIGFSYPD